MADEEAASTVVNESAVTDTAATESTTEETVSSQADTQDEVSQETEVTEQSETEETDAEQPKTRADARKEQLNGQIEDANREIRDLVAQKREIFAQREQLRQEVEQSISQAYKPATAEELLEQVNPDTGEYYNRLEAQLESLRQEREVERYVNQVSSAQQSIQYEAQQALSEFPMFDETSPEYNREIAAEVDAILAKSLQFDPNTGQVIGSTISPYQLYKSHAVAAKASALKAETTAQRNVEKMLNNSDPTTGGKGTTVPFEKMSLAQQEKYLRDKGHDV